MIGAVHTNLLFVVNVTELRVASFECRASKSSLVARGSKLAACPVVTAFDGSTRPASTVSDSWEE
jgi:hypothetical protein